MNVCEIIKVDPGAASTPSRTEWQSKLQQTVNGIHTESPLEDLGGELLSFNFSGARINYLHSNVQHISRPRQCPNRFAPMAVVPLTGGVTVTQLGRCSHIEPGQYFFMDSAAPMELEYSGEFRHLFLYFPASSFVPAVFHKAIARPVEAASDFDFLFKSMIEGIWRNAEDLPAQEHGAALNSVLSMCPLTSPFRHQAREIEPCIRVAKAMSYIEDNLAEEWLSPSMVADAQGVSRRYLDDRFGRLGLRIERWIWERRLLRAREDLSLASRVGRFTGKTILQVALDNGFKSPSHFSRSFSARFGVSPRDYRSGIEEQTERLH